MLILLCRLPARVSRLGLAVYRLLRIPAACARSGRIVLR